MNNNANQIKTTGIIAIMLISSLTVMVGTAITPALPELGRIYQLGNYASWLVTAPALGVVVTTVLFGRLIDKVGPYKIAFIGLLCYGCFGIAGAYMPNVITIFIDRLLLGAATAAVMNASVAFISSFFQGEQQLKILSIQSMSMEFGGVIFLTVSGILADISWRCPFYIYGLGFIVFIGLTPFIPRANPGHDPEILEQTENDAEKKGVLLGLVLVIAFLGMLMFFTAVVALPLYLQNQLGYSPSFTGYYLAALDLVAVVAAGFVPRVVKKIAAKGCLTLAFLFYAAGFSQYFFCGDSPLLWVAAICIGIGFGFSTPLFNNLIVNKSTAANKGLHISFGTMAMFTGQFLSALLISVLPAQRLFLIAALIALVIMVLILPVVKHYHQRRSC